MIFVGFTASQLAENIFLKTGAEAKLFRFCANVFYESRSQNFQDVKGKIYCFPINFVVGVSAIDI